jgi:TonB-linked SusC/RagA family outer membrane protein
MKNIFCISFSDSYLQITLKILFIVIFLLFLPDLSAQQRTITGTVTGTDNNPMPGVTIIVKGSTMGTTTGQDGRFSLSINESARVLVFSFMGMQTQEVPVTASNVYNVTLSESLVGLDEVIVIGYGTAKKSDLTGSVSRVEGEAIKIQAPTQVVETLSGTVAGLYANQATSAAGGGSMEIRGPSSLSAGTDPMIVLDGVIYNGSISDINPADIQSIDILRDASSAAVFGSKAASGVILITTTKGKIGKPTIDFSSRVGVAETTHDLKPYGPKEYLEMHRDYLRSLSPNLPSYFFHNPNELPDGVTLQMWRDASANPAADNMEEWFGRIRLWPIEIQNYKAGKVTDFYDLVVVPGLRQDYNLSAGGATNDVQYYWSVGYLDNEGIIKGDKFSTVRSRLNLDLTITDWLNVGANTQFALRDESAVPGNLNQMVVQSPYGSMWNDDGTLRKLPNDYSVNPLENYYGQDRERKINSLFSSLYGQIKLPFGFSFRVSFQPRFEFTRDYNFWSSRTTTGGETYIGGYGTRSETNLAEWMLDNLLKWNKEFGIHKFDLTLLANAEQLRTWNSQHNNQTFAPNQNLGFNALQFGAKPGLADSDLQSRGDALMARLNYTLLDRYLFTGSVRRDGYSAFGQQNPRATFPAFAFAWQVSEEPFYKISWMNRLKLRLSWGENGNRDIGVYSALARVGSLLDYDGKNLLIGVYNTTLANAGLRWERTVSTNIGMDIGLFENRIDMSIDAYDAYTVDLLLNRQLPRITGFTSITSNLGKLRNRGLEVSLNTVNLKGQNLEWRSNLVFSLNRNRIDKLWGNTGEYTLLGEKHTGEVPDFVNRWFPGKARDVVWDYEVSGIWQSDEKDAAAVYKLFPGDYKATDVNNDGKYIQLDDKKFIGYTDPRYRIGFKNDFSFLKHFSVSLFIRADLGHIRQISALTAGYSTLGRTNYWGFPYWSPEHPSNEYHWMTFPENYDKYGGSIRIFKHSGFVRVQDLNLSYNLPSDLTQKLKLKSLRVSGTVRNLFTFSSWPGFDPESGMTPMPKVFTIGLDLSL